MRIAINARFLLPGKIEGIGRVSYELIKRFVREHPKDQFLLIFDRDTEDQYDFGPNVEKTILFPPARHPLLFILWFEISLFNCIKKWKADIFYSPDGFCCLRSKVPTVITCHDLAYLHYPKQISLIEKWYYQFFVPRFLAKAEATICVSKATKDDVIRHFPSVKEKTYSISNGPTLRNYDIVLENTGHKPVTDGLPYFLYVGAIHPRKNIVNLIKAFSLFKTKYGCPHTLIITGRNAWQTQEVNKAFKESKFQSHINFTGYLSEYDLWSVLKGSDLFLYLSLFEGFGLPILEAFSAEIPVITSNRSSMPEVAGNAAILVDPMNLEMIADAMYEVVSDKNLKQELIKSGLEQLKKFNWDQSAQDYWKIFQTVIQKSS